ncbi:hypothetical protein [Rhodococcus opacus]|nr:hypothetical protein [Rhodococcus opacus]
MPSVAVQGRADLTDAQWARLVPLLPRGKKGGPPAEVDETATHRWD